MDTQSLILAPTHAEYQHYAHRRGHSRMTKYVGQPQDFYGFDRSVPFVVVGSFSPKVQELRWRMLQMGYKELE